VNQTRFDTQQARTAEQYENAKPIGEVLETIADQGKRARASTAGEYRVRRPTRSERLNRALAELRPAAFKVHQLLWTWRGAPARGRLPFFTFHSLSKFCCLTRPTVRDAFRELVQKGCIERLPYDAHMKNALYKLVPIRAIKKPDF